jgi:hypothetical protein
MLNKSGFKTSLTANLKLVLSSLVFLKYLFKICKNISTKILKIIAPGLVAPNFKYFQSFK